MHNSTTNKYRHINIYSQICRYDSRVKAMEVDEKPTEEYSDVGGLDKQIQELVEAVVLPMTHKDRFEAIGIQPPKGSVPFPLSPLFLCLLSFFLLSLFFVTDLLQDV